MIKMTPKKIKTHKINQIQSIILTKDNKGKAEENLNFYHTLSID